MIHVDFYNKTRQKVSAKIFEELLAAAKKYLVKDKTIQPAQKFTCELTLVGNSAIQKLNREYHGKDRPTDVISLSYFSKKMKDDFVGEIFISVPYAREQAKKIGQSLKEELRFLFVHGLLHLYGYDHMKPTEEKQMLSLTYGILGRKR